jgi:hypothetical protein
MQVHIGLWAGTMVEMACSWWGSIHDVLAQCVQEMGRELICSGVAKVWHKANLSCDLGEECVLVYKMYIQAYIWCWRII